MTVWERFGILVYPDLNVVSNQIKRLPPGGARRLWEVAWRRVRNNRYHYRHSYAVEDEFTFSSINEPHQLAQRHEFEVAALEETRAGDGFLEIPEGEGKLFGDVEGVRLCEIDQSQKFGHSHRRSQELVRTNKSVEILWQERFQRFAAFSQSVVIFDRYAVRDDDAGNIQGLFRFLDFLDRDSNGCDLTVYSSVASGSSIDTEVPSIKSKFESKVDGFNGRGIKRLEVRLFRDDRFRRPGHDRHIRFDDNVFSIGIGTELFRHQTVQQDTDCILTVLELGRLEERTRRLDNDRDARIAVLHIPISAPHS